MEQGRQTDSSASDAAWDTSSVAPLLLARALRDFGDGFAAVLLPAYLLAIELSPWHVGVLSSVSLFGSSLLTLAMGMLGARLEHRRLLLAAACLMAVTGIMFSVAETYAVLLLVAFAGTINPSSGNVSVFVPIEHAVLSRAVAPKRRTALFARYSLVGALAGAMGALSAATPDILGRSGIDHLTAIKGMFVLYALLGVAGCLIYRRLPHHHDHEVGRTASALGPSRKIVFRLAALFSLDSFAGGFVVQSLLALWLFQKFEI